MKFLATSMMALVMLMSCQGLNSRGDGMMGTVASTYTNIIEPIVIVGIGAEQDAGNLTDEQATQLRSMVAGLGSILNGGNLGEAGSARTAWDMLRPFAEATIDSRVESGDIGAGVGASLKEVLRLFGERLVQIAEAPKQIATAVETDLALEFECDKFLTLSQ